MYRLLWNANVQNGIRLSNNGENGSNLQYRLSTMSIELYLYSSIFLNFLVRLIACKKSAFKVGYTAIALNDIELMRLSIDKLSKQK